MADQLEFRSKLHGILEVAVANQNKITCEEVEAYFAEDQLNQEQIELVYDYLLAQKVAVKGYVSGSASESASTSVVEYSADEQAYLSEYETDLQAISGAKPGELVQLYVAAKDGDVQAKARITEIYLPKVVEIGKAMYRPEIFLGDMIQEGNVSLMLALEALPEELEEKQDVDADSEARLEQLLSQYIEVEVRQGMQMLIEETVEFSNRDKQMVQKVSELDDTITKLTEDLGRKVTIDELALYMEVSEAEILEILKLTGEEVEEDENATGIKVEDLGIQVLDK